MQPIHEPTAAPQPAGITLKTARPWRVATVAFLTLLVLVAVFGNQWVTDKIGKHYRGARFADNAGRSIQTYQWRFSPAGGHDYGHVWAGNLAFVGTVLVVTLLLVAVVARGRGGFGQTFVGTWLVVIAATVLARYVRGTVIAPGQVGLTQESKLNAIFFSSLAPGAAALFAAAVFGFIVALVAGLAAPLSRRTEVITPSTSTDAAALDDGRDGERYPASSAADDDDATSVWPRVDAPYEPPTSPPYVPPASPPLYEPPPAPTAYAPPPSPPAYEPLSSAPPYQRPFSPAGSSAAGPGTAPGPDEGHTAVLPAVESAPVESTPVESTPVDPAPVDPAPVGRAPVGPAPVDPAPVDSAAIDPVPADPGPADPGPAGLDRAGETTQFPAVAAQPAAPFGAPPDDQITQPPRSDAGDETTQFPRPNTADEQRR